MATHCFGSEEIDRMLGMLKVEHIVTMMKYPEDALTQDLPNLLFFNRDFPENQTVSVDFNTGTIIVLTGRVRGKWRPLPCLQTFLKNVARHYKKIVEYGRKNNLVNSRVTLLEQGKLNEYLRVIDTGKEVISSEYCPYYADLIDGRITTERLSNAIVETVKVNCRMDVKDWIQTMPYADENLPL
eukprot:gene19576-26260_t